MSNTLADAAKEISIPADSQNIYKRFIRTISLFSEFNSEAIDSLVKQAYLSEYKKGKILFFNGDKASTFYIVLQGWVKLFRETRDGRETTLSLFTAGEYFGRNAVLKDSAYCCSAQPLTYVTLLAISAEKIMHLAKYNGVFDSFMLKLFEDEYKDHYQRGLAMEHQAFMTSPQRVGCFMLRLCGIQQTGSITLQLPYDKSLIAAQLCMTPETFSRSLNQLKSIGVETRETQITIHNIEQLKASVCGYCSATKSECNFSDDGVKVIL